MFNCVYLCSLCILVSVASPMVPGGMRNIHEGKVSEQMGTANHHPDRNNSDDYMNMVHRLGNEVLLILLSTTEYMSISYSLPWYNAALVGSSSWIGTHPIDLFYSSHLDVSSMGKPHPLPHSPTLCVSSVRRDRTL